MNNGYNFYFDTPYGLVTFPITPGELKIKTGSNNSVVTLINEGDVNILKSPSLIEVDFEARFPMRKYPYSREPKSFNDYFSIFKKVKENKKPFRFIVARTTPNGTKTWDTNLLMALETLETHEDADEGDDVIVSFKLKQYKEYGVKIIPIPSSGSTSNNSSGSNNSNSSSSSSNSTTTSTASKPRDTSTKKTIGRVYIVKKGDTLWAISKKYYGTGMKCRYIYDKNKTRIEETAKKHGKKSSSNGHWIFPGTKLTIPKL